MKNFRIGLIAASIISANTLIGSVANADGITEAIVGGKASADINFRFEGVENGDVNSEGVTVRTRLGYTTAAYEGFTATIEFEDVRDVLGVDDRNGLIPDSEVTELEQAFLQYKGSNYTGKLGRQVIALDGHRHVGHVGWRQDRQTFDAARVMWTPVKDLAVDISYIYKVNRIHSGVFADVNNTNHKLLNVSYNTPVGKAVVYGYLLSEENSGPTWDETDTYGFSFTGKTKGDTSFLYAIEYATQDNATDDVDTDYLFAEVGVSVSGITGKIGYEVLGSDDGIGNFQTPLATVHKFNGWADVHLGGSLFGTIDGGNGLTDTMLTVATNYKGTKLVAVYHDYESDEGSSDLGSEVNLLAARKFGKHYNGGIKFADYSGKDAGANGGNDKQILWVWAGMKF